MTTIRLATEADTSGVQAIYAPVVRDTIISFEYAPPSVDEMRGRIAKTLPRYPWLVCEREHGELLGYAYAGQHSERAAYQWSVNVSVYVSASARRLGVGTAVYHSLFALLRLQGFANIYAGITLPNAASVGLHESMGMTPVGVYHRVGYKFGAWHDVGWWQMALRERPVEPTRALTLAEAQASAGWAEAMAAGQSALR